MSERFTRRFSLPENLHAPDVPVMVAAGALLQDNQSGRMLAQIKLNNIDERNINEVTLRVQALDAAGAKVGEPVLHTLSGFDAARGTEFGQKKPAVLPAGSESFAVEVCEVAFAGGAVWTGGGQAWASLGAPVALETALENDWDMIREYRVKYGGKSVCMMQEAEDLWRCTCGAINRSGEEKCHNCGAELAALKEFSVAGLAAAKEERLAAAAAAAEAARAAAEAKKKKTRKTVLMVLLGIVAAIAAAILITNAIKKNNAYKDAIALLEAGQYDAAEIAFTEMGDYKDSEAYLADIPYLEAHVLYDAGKLDEAREAFLALGDYKDSAEIAADIPYQQAVAMIENGKLDEARAAFTALGDYKDSKDYLADIPYLEAHVLLDDGRLDEAEAAFKALGDYKDSKEIAADIPYQKAMIYMDQGEYQKALDLFTVLGSYKDSEEQAILATQALCEHDYTSEVTKEPNCTETGIRLYTCGKCAKTYEETMPIVHKHQSKVTRAATCSKVGERTYTCTECGDTYTEDIAMIPHTWKAATCTASKACTVCGKKEGNPLPHNYAAATCLAPKTCVDCGATTGSVAAHNYAAATCTNPRTCILCGATTGYATGHRWVAATCAAPKTCSTCGETEGRRLSHDFYSYGGTSYTGLCRNCGEKDDDWKDYIDYDYSDVPTNGFQIVGVKFGSAHKDGSWLAYTITVTVEKVEESSATSLYVGASGFSPSRKSVGSMAVGDTVTLKDDHYFYGDRSYDFYISAY